MAGTLVAAVNREGWVPVRIGLHGPEAWIDWCRLGAERFREPFFDSTIEMALRKPFNALFSHRTSISELGAWSTLSPGLEPSGFIFHMSRCGSTLVSQMLAALPENVVISEAGPVDRLARTTSIAEGIRAEWLRWMVSALGQRRQGGESRYFIKFDSVTVTALAFIRRVFPAVPWIFIYRNPEEVLVSHRRKSAAAMSPGMITHAPVIDGSMNVGISGEEYAARVLGRLCECVCEGLDAAGMLVNYTQLPEAVWGAVAAHFGTPFSGEEIDAMKRVASFDAKRPSQMFEADLAGKRREISEAVRGAADRWVWPSYERLELLRG